MRQNAAKCGKMRQNAASQCRQWQSNGSKTEGWVTTVIVEISRHARKIKQFIIPHISGFFHYKKSALRSLQSALLVFMLLSDSLEHFLRWRRLARDLFLLSQKYQAEQEELEQKIQTLKTDMNTVKETAENAEKWIELIKKIGYPKELNAELLNTLIEKILIHEATKDEFGTRNQDIEIIYRFVGKID